MGIQENFDSYWHYSGCLEMLTVADGRGEGNRKQKSIKRKINFQSTWEHHRKSQQSTSISLVMKIFPITLQRKKRLYYLILTINQHLKKFEECLIAGSEKKIIVILLDKVKYFFNHIDSKLYFIVKQTSFRCIGNRNLR